MCTWFYAERSTLSPIITKAQQLPLADTIRNTMSRSAEMSGNIRPTDMAAVFAPNKQGNMAVFPGTELLEEARRGEFTPLSEKEMLVELKTFVENLTCDCSFITHHTISGKNLTGPDFLKRKESIIAALEHEIEHGDPDVMAAIRRSKRTL